ncbi:MAG: TlpA family protein disulfide reductase [Spirochaetia bacterium]|nr:TlpA family protein disulfide reductase [Spirochaetia bacterium]
MRKFGLKSLVVADKDQENFFLRHIINPVRTSPITSLIFLVLIAYVSYQQFPIFLNSFKMTGEPAPDFLLLDMDGNEIRLSDLKGKKIAINFWATWCAPCRVEIPVLNSLYPEIKNDSFELLAVSSETKKEIAEFTRATPINYPVLIDSDFTAAENFNIIAYPTFVYIDENGIITDIDSGVNFFLKWKLRYYATDSIF